MSATLGAHAGAPLLCIQASEHGPHVEEGLLHPDSALTVICTLIVCEINLCVYMLAHCGSVAGEGAGGDTC